VSDTDPEGPPAAPRDTSGGAITRGQPAQADEGEIPIARNGGSFGDTQKQAHLPSKVAGVVERPLAASMNNNNTLDEKETNVSRNVNGLHLYEGGDTFLWRAREKWNPAEETPPHFA